MENCVVIYKSKTGFTEKYANWIAEALGCEVYPLENINLVHLADYDVIIFGGGVRAGKINGVKFVETIRNSYPHKKLVVFATGAAPADESETVERIRKMNVPRNSAIPFFYFQSGINYEKMKGFDRVIMTMVRNVMRRTKDKDGTRDDMISAMKNSYDHSSRESIEPLVNDVRAL